MKKLIQALFLWLNLMLIGEIVRELVCVVKHLKPKTAYLEVLPIARKLYEP